jgi:hypothetical protein
MSARIIDGKSIAAKLQEQVAAEVDMAKSRLGFVPRR